MTDQNTDMGARFDPSALDANHGTAADRDAATRSVVAELTGVVDLASLDLAILTNGSTPVAILHPITKADTGQRIWLFGKEGQRVQDYINGEANARLRKNADLASRGKDPEAPTVEKGIASVVELLIVATDRWEGVFFNGERDAQFTVAKAKELYQVKFIREQLNTALNDVERFTTA